MKRFLPLLLLLSAFTLPQDNPMIKGRLKQVNHYMSKQQSNFFYDELGRITRIEEPYGETYTYTYNANFIYRHWKDPRGRESYDTIIEKAVYQEDSMIGSKSFWKSAYDLEGNMALQTYHPLKGKMRKAGKEQYRYHYDYYPQKWDSTVSMLVDCECDASRHLLKTSIGINSKGDTTRYFNYKYILDSTGRVNTRMKYYRTGQLYDSIGYVYY